MRALWDLSKAKGIPVSIDWSFLNWTSEAALDENAELQGVKVEYPGFGYVNYTQFRRFDIPYEDRITFSDGTMEYTLYGSALDDLSNSENALITAIVFTDSATNASWTLAFENEVTKLPIRSPYIVNEFASPTLSSLVDAFAISEGGLAPISDRVYGSAQADLIKGGQERDFIKGGDGNDTLAGNNGRDELFGMEGDDRILGGGQNDVLHGNAGNDTLIGGRGDDRLFAGYDWDNNDDLLRGGHGDDFLWTSIGSDTLLGGAGDDEITADTSDLKATRILRGGDGNDTISDEGSKLTVMRGDGGNDMLKSLSTYGKVQAQLYGGTGNDTLFSRSSSDQLFGGAGNDKLISKGGNELAAGGAGDDTIRAGKGNDTLRGNSGDDHLFGEQGSDIFVFFMGGGADQIADYELGTDRLRIQSDLVGGMTDASQMLDVYSGLNADQDVVLTFDDGSSVEISNLVEDDLDQLALDIEFF